MGPLNLGAMVRPLRDENVYRVEGYYVWRPQVVKDDGPGGDGRYHLVHSRWPRSTGKGGWLTDSEIALAVGDRPEGPYEHLKVLLKGRGAGHWDELMAHNPKLKRFGDKWYLYYISSRSGQTRGHIRDSQRIGVAVADRPTGPFERFDEPLIEPSPPIHNVAVNPGVTETPDGRYLMILKGDIAPKAPTDPYPQRVQAMAVAEAPTGPFEILPEPAIADIDTEDASIWRDAARRRFFAVYHAHTFIGLIESSDGFRWRRAQHDVILEREIARADGTVIRPPEPLQRPSVFVEDGRARLLCLAVPESDDDWRVVTIPLEAEAE